eukprot:CAMPEP_0178566824 /NCGR_PEP_ID=MMETSP0697-20121206/14976_1 /TAXON_ID=265572 /ORGANISM="Extubocellulus spinifer, Strain CCMP396" /LENGTH=485 /DNA_ID=CAMNT_0020200673 /DNA_START=128 /DNA_END=1582 /DNA_ORIENTATION=+
MVCTAAAAPTARTAFVPRASAAIVSPRRSGATATAAASNSGILPKTLHAIRGGTIGDGSSHASGDNGNDYIDSDPRHDGDQSIVDDVPAAAAVADSIADSRTSTATTSGNAESLIHEFESELVKIRKQIEMEAEEDLQAWRMTMLERRRRRQERRRADVAGGSSSSSSSSRVVMSVDDDVVEVEDDVPVSDSEGTHDMERTRPVETSQVEVLESEDGSSLPGEEESVQETGADFHDSANNRPGDGSYEQVNAATELDDALGEENSMPGSEHGSVSESSDIDENSENDDRGWDEDVTDYDDVSAAEEESSPREYRDIDDAVENDIENEELLVDQEAEDDISKDEASSAADHEQYESDVAAVPASECQIEEEDVTDVSAATVDSNEAESEMYQEPVNNDATPKKKKKKSKAKRRRRKKKKGARKTKNSDVPVAQNLTDDEMSLSMHAAGARTTKNIALTASRRIVYYCVVIAIISSIKIALAALMKW